MTAGTIEEIERLVAETDDADDVLRGTVAALVGEPGIAWAGIAFSEDRALTLGPAAGMPDEGRRTRVPIVFQGAVVGELWADGEVGTTFLEDVAGRIAAQVLIGWDTGGVSWDP